MTPNVNTLKLNPNNPRTISKIKYEKLKKSLHEFVKMLEIRPIAYDEEGIIWGGNMRFLALQELIRENVLEDKPEYYKELKGFTLEEKKRFAIEDNVEFGDWDHDLLANEWSDLPLDDWGVYVGADWEPITNPSSTNSTVTDDDILKSQGVLDGGLGLNKGKSLRVICPDCGCEFEFSI